MCFRRTWDESDIVNSSSSNPLGAMVALWAVDDDDVYGLLVLGEEGVQLLDGDGAPLPFGDVG